MYLRDVLARLPTQLNSRIGGGRPVPVERPHVGRSSVGRLTMELVAHATMDVKALDHDGKVRLGDEVFVAQPNLLGSILVLARMGVSMPGVEIALHVLFVAFQAMKRSRHRGDVVTIDLQEACMERLTARMRFKDGLPAKLAAELVTQFHTKHAERYLLAFVYGHLGEHDLLKVRTDGIRPANPP
jgi:hypothetical protein